MAEKRETREGKEPKENLGTKIVRGVVSGAKTVSALGAINLGPKPQQPLSQRRVKALVLIVNRDDETAFKELLDEHSVSLGLAFAGLGTAHSTVLDYLGIGATEKAVMLCLIPESDERAILGEMRRKFSVSRAGKGIAFTLPLSGVSEIVANGLVRAADKTTDGSKVMKDEERKYDLIIAAVAVNHVDEAMDAARAAGAAGGTIVRARAVSNEKAEQFIGINLTDEQELLLIVAKRERKLAIMQALSEKAGLKTPAGGVIFSLPVDNTAGIAAADEAEERTDGGKSRE